MQNTHRNRETVEAKVTRTLITMTLIVNTAILLFLLSARLPRIF